MLFFSLVFLQGFLCKEINSFHAIDDVNRQLSRPRASQTAKSDIGGTQLEIHYEIVCSKDFEKAME